MKGKKLCKATAPPFKNKKLSKIVRTRAWLRKQVFENRTKENWQFMRNIDLYATYVIVYLFREKLKESFTEILMERMLLTLKLYEKLRNLFFRIKL